LRICIYLHGARDLIDVRRLETGDAGGERGNGITPDFESELSWELGEVVECSFGERFLGQCQSGAGECFRGLRGEIMGLAGTCQYSIWGLLIHVVVERAGRCQYLEMLMGIKEEITYLSEVAALS
jgi:hypothetical protein